MATTWTCSHVSSSIPGLTKVVSLWDMTHPIRDLPITHWPPTLSDIADGFALIEEHDTRVESILISKQDFNNMNWESQLDPRTTRDDPTAGSVWAASVNIGEVPSTTRELILVGELPTDYEGGEQQSVRIFLVPP